MSKIELSDYINNYRVRKCIDVIQQKKPVVSDIVDDKGNQYTNLVLEGGGFLGIALMGYVYALEQAGIRFLNIGGTSAGAVTASFVATADYPAEMKSLKVLDVYHHSNFLDFLDDGEDTDDNDVKAFVQSMLETKKNFFSSLSTGWKFLKVIDNLKNQNGLVAGTSIHGWITKTLNAYGVATVEELKQKMNNLPALKTRSGQPLDISARLAIITTELTTRTKVEFPQMSGLFYNDPDQMNPADFIRASLSVPLLFTPFKISMENAPSDLEPWRKIANFHGARLPKEAIFVDGALMSNFPIDVFRHDTTHEYCPTLGVKLGFDRNEFLEVNNILDVLNCCMDASINLRDFEFLQFHPEYQSMVGYIDTRQHSWINFEVNDEEKVDLFCVGVEGAKDFLLNFDWNEYKAIYKK
ncbi:MAG: patatin-like phospholipase family protein [Spirosomataceae bacterium]